MPVELSPLEARVIGCLIEKQITTPDQYAVSLKALRSACNQKSNRHPVLDVSEQELRSAVDGLLGKQLLLEKSGFGARVPKYQHLFCNTEFGSLDFTRQDTAIICELLLRGPQTPGELRSRAARMAPIKSGSQVERILEELVTRADGPFVARLPLEPGRREARYAQLFGGPVEADTELAPPTEGVRPATDLKHRVDVLESTVLELQRELDELKSLL